MTVLSTLRIEDYFEGSLIRMMQPYAKAVAIISVAGFFAFKAVERFLDPLLFGWLVNAKYTQSEICAKRLRRGRAHYVMSLFGPTIVLIGPEFTKWVLVTNKDKFYSGDRVFPSIIKKMFSRSLLGIENEPDQHTILRRIMAPPFRGSTLRSSHSEMIHHVRDFFKETKQRYQDRPVDFQKLFRQLAVKLALIMLLNCDSPDLLDYDHIAELSSAFVNDLRAFTVIARKDAQINAANGWNVIRGVAERIVKEKLATMDESETPDSIDLLVEAQRSNTVSDVGDLIQQTALILTAGHVTTGSILASFAAYTSTRPALIARLREEQSRFEDLESPDAHFPLLEATFREIERLENPVVMLRRLAKEDLRYVGSDGKEVVVKKGTLVTIDVSTTNRDPEVYERPDEFLPDRWLVGEGKVKSAPAVSLVTFGAGPRLCLGRDFARMEMIAVGCIMLRQFDWTRTEGPFEKVTFPIPQWKGGVCCYLDDLKL